MPKSTAGNTGEPAVPEAGTSAPNVVPGDLDDLAGLFEGPSPTEGVGSLAQALKYSADNFQTFSSAIIAASTRFEDRINKSNALHKDELKLREEHYSADGSAYKKEADAKLKAYQEEADAKLKAYQEEADAKLKAYQEEADAKLKAYQEEADAKLKGFKEEANAKLSACSDSFFQTICNLKKAQTKQIRNLKAVHAKELNQAKAALPQDPQSTHN